MNGFLVQVSKDIGYANIISNGRYQNHLWKVKPRDADHGKVESGDELIIYCTNNVPGHSMSLAFSVAVKNVSDDNVTFELEEPRWFPSPLKLQRIRALVNENKLSAEFRGCGQQGFNITKLDIDLYDKVMGLVGLEPALPSGPKPESSPKPDQPYTIGSILADGCFLPQPTLESMLHRLQTKQNIILQGPPGTGKTWLAKKLAYALIGRKDDRNVRPMQFHPNLSYEDFVRGWRPQGDGNLALVNGPFLQLVEEAEDNPDDDYVMVIEEINRGNPASIFGEMLTLLEADKRSPDEALALAYPREPDERVHIPSNIYVIGTMNTADRSIALVDLALRRRFAFFDLEPMLNETWRDWVQEQCDIDGAFLDNIAQRINSLNDEIASDRNLGRQFRIGHSFVTPTPGASIEDPDEWFEQVVETEIIPLLYEYWFDDPEKVADARSRLLGIS